MVLLYLASVYFGLSVGGLMDPSYFDAPWSWGKVASILEHLSGELCDAVLERTGSAELLRDAAGSNLLVFPMDRRGEQ